MKSLRWMCSLLLVLSFTMLPACSGGGSQKPSEEGTYGKYRLLGTRYDNADSARAKANADDALTQLQDEKNVCLIGLWAYNPPAILSAVKAARKEKVVHIVGFDEDENTLLGIKDGAIYGTVVQQPFEFGYQSVKLMSELVKDPNKPLPPGGIMHVPHLVIKKDNVEEFHQKLKELKALGGKAAPEGAGGERTKVGFVSNNEAEFWTIAEAGTRRAAEELGVEVFFRRPKQPTAAAQKEIIEDLLNRGAQAIAISVIDPVNQKAYLNQIAERVPLITQDNDAPDTKRKCYIGTDNYQAGRAVGKLVQEVMPAGGTIAIFVGQPDPLNAQQRRQGVLDELAGKKGN
jgi:ribose transport system substrate-binding protein